MSMLFMDGFDLYAGSGDLGYVYNSNSSNFLPAGGRFGGGGFVSQAFGSGFNGITKQLGSSNVTLWTSVAILVGTNGINQCMAWGTGASNTEVLMTYNVGTGTFTFTKGNGVLVGSVLAPMVAGWHWLDIRVAYSTTAGIIELWVDDVQVLNLTGINTEANAQTGWTSVSLLGNSGAVFDDLFIYTPGVRLGDSRIETVVPTSDATPNQGTPSTGTTHYGVVNEAQNNTSNYITMPNTSGSKEVFGVGSIISTPASVWAVQVKFLTQKSDAGSFQLEPLVISGAIEADGSPQQLLTSFGVQSTIFETNPHTSAAWVYTDTNTMDVGFKVF